VTKKPAAKKPHPKARRMFALVQKGRSAPSIALCSRITHLNCGCGSTIADRILDYYDPIHPKEPAVGSS